MTGRATADSIDDYISGLPDGTREALDAMRTTIAAAAPGAVETISYAIPTFDLHGRHLVHFAGYTKHVGFYPGGQSAMVEFADELQGYVQGKGSVRFPLDQPLPLDLVRRMVEHRVRQEDARQAGGS